MRIPAETVEQILQRADVLEVVSDFVSLKRNGTNWVACCPFHNEKSPSFAVSPAKGIYKCFGCGKGGDAVKFVMEIENLAYPEALRYLAKKYNIAIEERELTSEEQDRQSTRESLHIVLNFAKNYYQDLLLTHETGRSVGLSYFRERGFSEKTIRDFELGYSLESWDAFTQAALTKGYNPALLEKAGLTIRKQADAEEHGPPKPERLFDRFRGRVIFPIHNVAGKTIAFGARILASKSAAGAATANKAEVHQPKYLNSPETEVYHKSDVLYGLYQAKTAIRSLDNCYLVEGYTDVISLHQAGIENVVSSSGTSLTGGQIKLIGRFTQNITVLYDGDAAGIKASLRGTDLILEAGLNVRIVTFPDNDDPDSYVYKVGATAFKAFVETNRKDFIAFKTELLLAGVGKDPFRRAEVTQEVVSSISRIPDRHVREALTRQTAELLDVKEDTLVGMVNSLLTRQARADRARPAPSVGGQGVVIPNSPADITLSLGQQTLPNNGAAGKDNSGGSNKGGENNGTSPDGTPPEADLLALLEAEKRAVLTNLPPIYYQEQETVRLLLNYANQPVDEGVPLWHYLLAETEELTFHTPAYRQVMTLFRQEAAQGRVPTLDFFIRQGGEAQRETINLITDKYELSQGWRDKHGILVPLERDKLYDMAYTNLLRLKRCHLTLRIEDTQAQLARAADEADTVRLLQILQRLKQTEMAIAREFGNVTRA